MKNSTGKLLSTIILITVFSTEFYGQCLSFSLTVVPPSCLGCCDGSITVNNLTGGCPPYLYTWSDGTNGPWIPELCYDTTYSLTIIDNGCCPDTTVPCMLSSPTGINNGPDEDHSFLLVDNPVSGQLNIELPQISPDAVLRIYNIQGQPILQKTITSLKTGIDVSFLAKGMYLIKMISNNKTRTARFVKE
jgi:hypothetical protein